MVLFFIFLFFLLVNNLLLPALVGPKEFLVVPVFLMSVIVYSGSFKLVVVRGVVFSLTAELLSGMKFGDILVPFSCAVLIYLWISSFLEIKSGLTESSWPIIVLGSSLFLIFLTYIYSWGFIFNQSSYSLITTWSEWKLLFHGDIIINTFLWAAAFSYLFHYVIQKK